MDNFAYLNQISQSNRPTKRPTSTKGNMSTSLIIKLVVGGVVLFFLLMALGSILSNRGSKNESLVKQLYLRTTNVNSTLSTYNRSVKSSQLKAIGVALSSVLTNTSNQLSSYITTNYGEKNLAPPESVSESEAAILTELSTTLENARLNGILDRHYDNQIGLQVSLMMAQTSQLLARTKDKNLIEILTTFYSSLETFHKSFEAFTSSN